ncbi:MAG TPA: hypothetical protein VG839_07135 [Asticcacaulis sp.]|nr:hypothetical protein [Asticcacaulis sp.]
MRLHAAGLTGLVSALCLIALPAAAQEVVAASNMPVAAGDVATVAVAQLNDAADAAAAQKKIDLYKQFMELNGTSRNIRESLEATKASTKLIVLERAGKKTLTADEDKRYSQIADSVMKDTEASLIDQIARNQSQSFSADEIQQLIAANSTVAAAKYNSGKFMGAESDQQEIQNYMTAAVVRIVKTFNESIAG